MLIFPLINQKTQLEKVTMKYTESQLEQAFISLLETEGYHYINGKELTRTSNQEVLLKEDIRHFLLNRYPDLEEIELESLVNEIAFSRLPIYTIPINTSANYWQMV